MGVSIKKMRMPVSRNIYMYVCKYVYISINVAIQNLGFVKVRQSY